MKIVNRNKKEEKIYTVMFIPYRGGVSKIFNIRRISIISIISFVVLLIFLNIFSASKIYILLNKKQQLSSLNTSLREEILESQNKIDRLQILNENLIYKNNEYLNRNKEILEKLSTYKKYEEKLNILLQDENIQKKLSRNSREGDIKLEEMVDFNINEINRLIEAISEEIEELNKIPSVMPCDGDISSYFGYRLHPILNIRKMHTGLDIGGEYGQGIFSTADGTVTHAGWMSGYGLLVVIDHGNGYKTYYGHNSKILVKEGQEVNRKDKIALMGSTGLSTGVHCHYEIRYDNEPIDPFIVIKGGN